MEDKGAERRQAGIFQTWRRTRQQHNATNYYYIVVVSWCNIIITHSPTQSPTWWSWVLHATLESSFLSHFIVVVVAALGSIQRQTCKGDPPLSHPIPGDRVSNSFPSFFVPFLFPIG
jgi:hypothetical protein